MQISGRASSDSLGDLLSRAEKYFDLRPAERFAIERVSQGKKATILNVLILSPSSSSPSSQGSCPIRSKVLQWLIIQVNKDERLHNTGVQIENAIFESLNLSNMRFTINLCLTSCVINGELDLRNAHTGQLDFEGCKVTSVIRASNLEVNGDLYLNGTFEAEHGIYMTNARISGDFDCRGARFGPMLRQDFKRFDDHPFDDKILWRSCDDAMPSVVANRLKTEGSVLLSGIKPNSIFKRDNIKSTGIIQNLGTYFDEDCIDDTHDCPRNCRIMNCPPVINDTQNVWSLGRCFKAEGTIYLMNADIKGIFRLSCAKVYSKGVHALRADRMKTGGSVLFCGVDVAGQIRLTKADIGNKLTFSGGVFPGPDEGIIRGVKQNFKKAAIYLDGIHVASDLVIEDRFKCSSEFRMIGAHVDGNMLIDNAEFKASEYWEDGVALSMSQSAIKGKLGIYRNTEFAGTIHMNYCEISGELFISAKIKSAVPNNKPNLNLKYLDNRNAISAQCTKVSGDVKFGFLKEDEGENEEDDEESKRAGEEIKEDIGCKYKYYYIPSINMAHMSIGKNLVFGGAFFGTNEHIPVPDTCVGYEEKERQWKPKAIDLNGAKIEGSVYFRIGQLPSRCKQRFEADPKADPVACREEVCPMIFCPTICGTADLSHTRINLNIDLSGARFTKPKFEFTNAIYMALDLSQSIIGGELIWCQQDEGQIAGNDSINPLDRLLDRLPFRPHGRVSFAGSRVGRLNDCEESWPTANPVQSLPGSDSSAYSPTNAMEHSGNTERNLRPILVLDGFTYDALHPKAANFDRIKWIKLNQIEKSMLKGKNETCRSNILNLQPYEQLSRIYYSMGLPIRGREVEIEKQNQITEYIWRQGPLCRCLSEDNAQAHKNIIKNLSYILKPNTLMSYSTWLFEYFWRYFVCKPIVAYGYKPFRALVLLVCLWFAGIIVLLIADYSGVMITCDYGNDPISREELKCPKNHPDFSSWRYSSDLINPVPSILSFNQGEYWKVRNIEKTSPDYDFIRWVITKFVSLCIRIERIGSYFLTLLFALSPTRLVRLER